MTSAELHKAIAEYFMSGGALDDASEYPDIQFLRAYHSASQRIKSRIEIVIEHIVHGNVIFDYWASGRRLSQCPLYYLSSQLNDKENGVTCDTCPMCSRE